MEKKMENIIKTIYDNSKDGRPSFNIKTEDGRTFYANEFVDLERGDRFTCDLSEMKTSKQGNQYYNASNVRKLGDMQTPPSYVEDVPMQHNNANLNSGLRVDASMFITGIVTRSMGSGQFGISDIEPLTAEAVKVHKKYFG
tara:strand:+ start:22 stop:444 length:423 start_codon:yes stop_codon:yes gene_type:complete